MKVVYTDGMRIPIKMWLDDIEDGALKQAMDIAHLPFVFKHIAIMPDCLAEGTEALTVDGFKKIADLSVTEDKVANYNPETNKIFFDNPTQVVDRPLRESEKMFEFVSTFLDKGVIVSEKHRMPYVENMGTTADKLMEKTRFKDYVWSATGLEDDTPYDISYELLCLIAWCVGDGNIKNGAIREDGSYGSRSIRFGFTKDRKIKRVSNLLNALGFRYNLRKDKYQTAIEMNVEDSKQIIEYIGVDKSYPVSFIAGLSNEQGLIFLEEALKVDGDWINYQTYGVIRYHSKREKDVNFLSSLAAIHLGLTNDNTRMSEGYNVIKMHYMSVIRNSMLSESGNGMSNSTIMKREMKYNKNVVCITCTSGFFIARQNGLTFISGNCHQGYGMPIGGVVATKGIVVPNFVGVDIGCGVCIARTPLEDIDHDTLKKIKSRIEERIPVGFDHHKVCQDWKGFDKAPDIEIVSREHASARKQIGTLGGGNHFIEIQRGSDMHIWIMIHSGSRNFGFKIAREYHNKAVNLCEKWYSNIPNKDLSFLPMQSEEAYEYIHAMEYALEFAKASREMMMTTVISIFGEYCGYNYNTFDRHIDVHHNYAAWENHFGSNIILHRKGAISAREDQIGIIPGSQGTKSYIVKGKGNPESFMSCSHGAGRRMGRKQAKRELDLQVEIKRLDDADILHSVQCIDDLDEAPGAYKSISEVMNNQKDLVEIDIELTPIAVVKDRKKQRRRR